MKEEIYSNEEKKELLKIARTTLELYLKEERIYKPVTQNENFLAKRGVFVTLHRNNQLRGCIGNIVAIKPLIEAVRDNAIAAAVEDPRFLPMTKQELPEVDIEISILTEPKLSTLDQIKPGDGVIIKKNGLTATFLPQVWEDLPEKEKFLSQLCQKAGLTADEWQDPQTQFETYQAIVFGEK